MSHPDYDHVGCPVDKLLEELHEVGMAVCKAKRFGWLSRHPDKPEGPTNFEHLRDEMQDLTKRWEELVLHLQHRASSGELE
jgi:hypothetical protein